MAKEKKTEGDGAITIDVSKPKDGNKVVISGGLLNDSFLVKVDEEEKRRVCRALSDSAITHFSDGFRSRPLFSDYDVLVNLPFQRYVYFNESGNKITVNCIGVNSLNLEDDVPLCRIFESQPSLDTVFTMINSSAVISRADGNVFLNNVDVQISNISNSTISVDLDKDNRILRGALFIAESVRDSVVYDSVLTGGPFSAPNLSNAVVNSSSLVGNVELTDSSLYKTTLQVNEFSSVNNVKVARSYIAAKSLMMNMTANAIVDGIDLETDTIIHASHPIMLGTLVSGKVKAQTWWSVEIGKSPVFHIKIENSYIERGRELHYSHADDEAFSTMRDDINEACQYVLGFRDDNLPGNFASCYAKQFANFAVDRMNICLFYMEKSIADGVTEY